MLSHPSMCNPVLINIVKKSKKNKIPKGQLISKVNCQAVNASRKRTNGFNFTTMQLVLVRFLEEIEDTKETFRNYLTFEICRNM